MIILGGGYIALELGQMFSRFGTSVTILERSAKVLKDYEPEVSSAITEALIDEGVNIVINAHPGRVFEEASGVVIVTEIDRTEEEFRADRVLVATGRTPNTDLLNLAAAGVRIDEAGFVVVDDELRTSVPHIWAAGDVIGRHTGSELATPVGAHDGGIAARNALGDERRKVDHRVIPRTIFTDPQVAVVGLTDAEGARSRPPVLVQHDSHQSCSSRRGHPRHSRYSQDGYRRRHEPRPRCIPGHAGRR